MLLNSIGDPDCRPAYIARLGRLLPRPPARAARARARPPRAQPAPAARLEGSGDGRAQRRRAADHRPPVRACADHFAAVRAHLDALGVAYRAGARLVRGLDYYTRTAFEFYRRGAEGQQQALGGGGRYDGLVELLGGKPTPGIGFALGLDRVVLALDAAGGGRPADAGSGRRRRRRRSCGHREPAADRDRAAAAGLPVRADLGRRKLGRQLEAAAREGRPLRRDPRRRAGRRGRPAARPATADRSSPCRSPTWPALLRRKVRT